MNARSRSCQCVLLLAVACFVGNWCRGQILDEPTVANAWLYVSGGKNPNYAGGFSSSDLTVTFTDSSGFAPLPTYVSGDGSGVWGHKFLPFEPGRNYTISVSGNNMSEYLIQVYSPPGYVAVIDGLTQNGYVTDQPGTHTFRLVPQRTAFTGPPGSSSSLSAGKMYWEISLGSTENGSPAGDLAIINAAKGGNWSDIWNPDDLSTFVSSSDVVTYQPNGVLRQVVTPQVYVDINPAADGNSYTIDFYNRATTTTSSSAFPYVFSGNPYVTYTISNDSASPTMVDVTKTLRKPDGTAALILVTSLARTGTDATNFVWTMEDWHVQGTTAVVTEKRTWGTTTSLPANSNIPASTTSGRTEKVEVSDANGISSTSVKTFADFPWGEELVRVVRGTGTDTVEQDYAYGDDETNDPKNYGYLISKIDPNGGGWEAYSYIGNAVLGGSGQQSTNFLSERIRPFGSNVTTAPSGEPNTWTFASGEITSYQWGDNLSFTYDRSTEIDKTIDGTQVSKTNVVYQDPLDEFDANGNPGAEHTINGMDVVVATRSQTTDGGSNAKVLKTVTKYYREDTPDELYSNQIHSVLKPDNVMVVYAYQRGTYDASKGTFTADSMSSSSYDSSAPEAVRKVTITGTAVSNGTTEYKTFDGYQLTDTDSRYADHFYLLPNKSTMDVTIRDATAMVRRKETLMWDGSKWRSVGWTSYTYDFADRLVERDLSNGEKYVASYDSTAGDSSTDTGRLQWEQNEEGIRISYTYDNANRVATAEKSDGPTTTYGYNADGFVTRETVSSSDPADAETIVTSRTYDQAQRLLSETKPGRGTVQYSYDASARTKTVTQPLADATATAQAVTEWTYQPDGRVASVTGSGVVSKYYTYSVDANGFLWTRLGAGTSGPKSTDASQWDPSLGRQKITETDWLGRIRETKRQGFNGGPDFVVSSIYNAGGQLSETDRSGYAPMLYEYDALSNVIRSGLGISNPTGPLDPSSSDRVTDMDKELDVESANNVDTVWIKTSKTTYPVAGDPSVQTFTRDLVVTDPTSSVQAETQSSDPDGNITDIKTSVDAAAGTVTVTTNRPGCLIDSVQVTTNGLVTSIKGRDGKITTFVYDGLDRLSTTTDPRTNVTKRTYYNGTRDVEYVYDAQAVAEQQKYAFQTFGYDNLGRKTMFQDAVGGVTRYDYDLRNQLLHQWGTGSDPVEYVYDSTYGDRTDQHTYRGDGTVDWSVSTWPKSPGTADDVKWAYDAGSGLLHTKTFPAADPSSSDPALNTAKTTTYNYNVRGQIASKTDARGVTTTYQYYGDSGVVGGATGELYSVTYSGGADTPSLIYTYTRGGQLSTVAEGSGSDLVGSWKFNYDPAHPWRRLNENLPALLGTRTLTSIYDTATKVSVGTSAGDVSAVPGRTTGFELDALNGGTGVDLHQNLTFNNLDRVSAVDTKSYANTAQDFTYSYDTSSLAGDPSFPGQPTGYSSGSLSVAMGYDPYRDSVSTIESSWGSTAITRHDYTFDYAGQRVSDQLTGSAYADYVDSTLSYHSVYDYYTHDLRGEIVTATMYRGDTVPSAPLSKDELPGRRFEYRYDDAGNRTKVGPVDPSSQDVQNIVEQYKANALNEYTSKSNPTIRVLGTAQVNSVVGVAGGQTDKLDRNFGATIIPDNGTGPAQGQVEVTADLSGTPDVVEQLSKPWFAPPASQVMTYDAEGNLLTDGVWSYTYDAADRLIEMKSLLPANAGFRRLQIDFKYDYLNRRIQKTVVDMDNVLPTVDRRYVYHGDELIAELDDTGAIVRSYTWGLDVDGQLTGTGGVGALLQISNFSGTGETKYFPTHDANGNISALIKASDGSIAAIYEYGAFGEPMRSELIDQTIIDDPNPFQFATEYTDYESGLVYYGRRYYSPSLGRFINRDPAEEAGGLNLYAFCFNDGVDRFDRLGMGGDQMEGGMADKVVVRGNSPVDSMFDLGHISMAPLDLSGLGGLQLLSTVASPDERNYIATNSLDLGQQAYTESILQKRNNKITGTGDLPNLDALSKLFKYDPFAPNNASPASTSWFGSVKTWVVDHVGWKGSVDFTLPLPNVFGQTQPGNPSQFMSFVPVGFHLDGTLSAKGLDFDLGVGLGSPISGSFGKLAKGFGFGASTGLNVIVYGSRNTDTTWDISGSGGDLWGGAVDFGMKDLSLKKVDVTAGLGMDLGVTITKNVWHKSIDFSSGTADGNGNP